MCRVTGGAHEVFGCAKLLSKMIKDIYRARVEAFDVQLENDPYFKLIDNSYG